MNRRDMVKRAAEILASSTHAIAFTGAGISTPSGIPDFRGPSGLWRRISPEVFEISYFRRHPEEAWRVFIELYKSIKGVKPNPAHYALAYLERIGVVKHVITQNIDRLHQAAGSRNVIELHGSIGYAVCLDCRRRIKLEEAIAIAEKGRPRCPYCGGLLKPDVVFFGETLPLEALERAFDIARTSDAVLVAGSSLYVAPARYVPLIAKESGARIIIVNMGHVYGREIADIYLEAPVEEALPEICAETARLLGEDPRGCRSPQDS
ncbi:MAG: NAD-dependent deacylase [Desulfurococcales archaeon]|nr:NAD-dependent deacylase [Desulfurococcales archaeon]